MGSLTSVRETKGAESGIAQMAHCVYEIYLESDTAIMSIEIESTRPAFHGHAATQPSGYDASGMLSGGIWGMNLNCLASRDLKSRTKSSSTVPNLGIAKTVLEVLSSLLMYSSASALRVQFE